MKLDIDYLRELLFELESCENIIMYVMGDRPSSISDDDTSSARIYDRENDKKSYHLRLLQEAKYLHNFRLTLEAHDFIEIVRGQDIWEETKNAISETGGHATLKMVESLAEGFLKKKISKHSGIDL